MPNEVNIYEPRYLAEVVRQVERPTTFFKSTFFTHVVTSPTEMVDIDLVKGDRAMAPFVHPMKGGKVMADQGYETESFRAPLVAPTMMTTADMLLRRMPGEDLYSGRNPAQRAADKLKGEYRKLDDYITRREEWMCASALINGKIHAVGDGVNAVIDFRLSQEHRPKRTGAASWEKPETDILGDLEGWVKLISTNGFANADTVVLGARAAKALLKNPEVRALLDNRRVEMGLIAPKALPKGVRYLGWLSTPGMSVDLYCYGGTYLDNWSDPAKPKLYDLMPENKVLVLSWEANYLMGYGCIAYLDEAQHWAAAMAPRTLSSWIKRGPDRKFLGAQARPLPVPDKVDSWVCAEVC